MHNLVLILMLNFLNTLNTLDMAGNYEERNVDNYKTNLFTVDTSLVTDRPQPYETAVAHKSFNGGDWVILEMANTKEDAKKIHEKWVEIFKQNSISELTDIIENVVYAREKPEPTQ